MSYAIYTAVVVGGDGPGSWEKEVEVDGDSFIEATQTALDHAADMRGSLFSIEVDVPSTVQAAAHTRET